MSYWIRAARCGDCNDGFPDEWKNWSPPRGENESEKAYKARQEHTLICRNCGAIAKWKKDIGRKVSQSVWYKPWTWFLPKTWEWRSQTEKEQNQNSEEEFKKLLDELEKISKESKAAEAKKLKTL